MNSVDFSIPWGTNDDDSVIDGVATPDNGFTIMGNRCNNRGTGCDIGPNNVGRSSWIQKFEVSGNVHSSIGPIILPPDPSLANRVPRGLSIIFDSTCDHYIVTGVYNGGNSTVDGTIVIVNEDLTYDLNDFGVRRSLFDYVRLTSSVLINGSIYTTGTYTDSSNSEDDIIFLESKRVFLDNNGSSGPILDLSTITRTITIPAGFSPEEPVYLELCVRLDHTYTGDLTLDLTSPMGTTVRVYDMNCGTFDDIIGCFSTEGVNPISCPVDALFSGDRYIPDSPLTPFTNEVAAGVWTLTITDHIGGDDGWFYNWELNIITDTDCDSNCPPNFAGVNMLTGTQSVAMDFETDGIIESTQIIDANVDYDSGTHIDLLAGFEVKIGKLFHAFIDGCGNLFRDDKEEPDLKSKSK